MEGISQNQLLGTFVIVLFTVFAWRIFYNLFLHPLRTYPGPISHRISRFPVVIQLWQGKLVYHLEDLHARYGAVVRTAPDELSFLDARAWKDIYGRRTDLASGLTELPKWQRFYKVHATKGQTTIFNADHQLHTLLRRQLAHGFSERSMQEQEATIGGYVDLLMRRLRENSNDVVDLTTWYVWATFDIIGDLALGSSFGCLEKQDWHPWVWQFVSSPREFTFLSGLRMLRLDLFVMIGLSFAMPARKKILALTKETLKRRLERTDHCPDLIAGMLKNSGTQDLDFSVIHGTARSLVFAGSETTATLLSGVTFLLLTNPEALERVKKEVRSTFTSEKDITLLSVSNLAYMLACLKEALRLYPPVPTGLPRYTPRGGAVIAGHAVPENTIVYVPHVAMYRSPMHWTQAEKYRPERFLGNHKFSSDRLDVLQPFSFGPRNCIGMNLAFAEMRLILARLLYSFDLELSSESAEWLNHQEAYLLWRKPALNVKLTPVLPA